MLVLLVNLVRIVRMSWSGYKKSKFQFIYMLLDFFFSFFRFKLNRNKNIYKNLLLNIVKFCPN